MQCDSKSDLKFRRLLRSVRQSFWREVEAEQTYKIASDWEHTMHSVQSNLSQQTEFRCSFFTKRHRNAAKIKCTFSGAAFSYLLFRQLLKISFSLVFQLEGCPISENAFVVVAGVTALYPNMHFHISSEVCFENVEPFIIDIIRFIYNNNNFQYGSFI